jgi:hypothetical protein
MAKFASAAAIAGVDIGEYTFHLSPSTRELQSDAGYIDARPPTARTVRMLDGRNRSKEENPIVRRQL